MLRVCYFLIYRNMYVVSIPAEPPKNCKFFNVLSGLSVLFFYNRPNTYGKHVRLKKLNLVPDSEHNNISDSTKHGNRVVKRS